MVVDADFAFDDAEFSAISVLFLWTFNGVVVGGGGGDGDSGGGFEDNVDDVVGGGGGDDGRG